MKILIKNGRIIDPANQVDTIGSLYITDGKITQIAPEITRSADKIIDAKYMWVTPGLIDVHVHLRQPGYEHKETIKTGARSGAKGGFTTLCAMPNTRPVTDCEEVINTVLNLSHQEAIIDILLIGAATKGQKGEELSRIESMAKAGACAISEDGYSVLNSLLAKQAFAQCAKAGVPMLSHCEDLLLADGGVINQGEASNRLNLPGISNDSEEVIVSRDMILANAAHAKLHLCHMSTKGSVELIRDAKAKGFQVSAEACPHHFTLSDDQIQSDDGNYKMNPPLRSKQDVAAIIEALKDNTIDVIATDHAPHAEDEKTGGFLKAANGIVGLETAIALCVTQLVKPGHLTPSQLIKKLTVNPANVIGINKGTLSIGACADVAIIDVEHQYNIDAADFESKGKNTPFGGKKVYGKVQYVIKDGFVIVENAEIV